MKSKWKYFLGLVLLFIPLFFINIGTSHNWGGDFSQYIQQAKNVAEGKAQIDQHYVYNPRYPELAPPLYSPGFPLLLAPVIKMYGVDYPVLYRYITLWLVAFLLSSFLFSTYFTSDKSAFFIVLLCGYLPWILLFKGNVLSDIPFAFFVALALVLYSEIRKSNQKWWWLSIFLGFTCGFSYLIKPMGLAFAVALVIDIVLSLFNRYDRNITLRFIASNSIALLIFSVFYLFVSDWLLGGEVAYVSHFNNLFAWDILQPTIEKNFHYNLTFLYDFFKTYRPSLFAANVLFCSSAILLIVFGGLKFFKAKHLFYYIFFFVFLGVIFLFPYQQGYRYLLPLTPIFLLFIIIGYRYIPFPTVSKNTILILIILVGHLVPLRYSLVQLAKDNTRNNTGGIKGDLAVEVFNYIEDNTTKEAVFVFIKPRVLALSTQRDSYCNFPYYPTWQMDKMKEDIVAASPDYLLMHSYIENPALQMYIDSTKTNWIVDFENQEFTLYRRKSL